MNVRMSEKQFETNAHRDLKYNVRDVKKKQSETKQSDLVVKYFSWIVIDCPKGETQVPLQQSKDYSANDQNRINIEYSTKNKQKKQ